MLTLLLGGARAGKSRRALDLADGEPHVTFVATAEAFDEEMDARIRTHKAERAAHWLTIEAPIALSDAIRDAPLTHLIIIDCITLWISNLLLRANGASVAAQPMVEASVAELLTQLATRTTHTIVVSNEVGLGIVPETPLGREYRDLLGRANASIAASADRVELLVAGLPLRVK